MASIEAELKTRPQIYRVYTADSELGKLTQKMVADNVDEFSEVLCQGKISPRQILGKASEDIHYLMLVKDGDVTQIAFAQGAMSNGEYHIDTICARPGQGGKLLDEIEAWAKKQGAKGITLDALPQVLGFQEKKGQTKDPRLPPEVFTDAKKQASLNEEYKKTVARLTQESRALRAKLGNQSENGVPMVKSFSTGAARRLRLKTLRRSHNTAKKWDAVFEGPDGRTKTVPFGQKGQSDFTKHRDTQRRGRYLQRHARMGEDWRDPTTPGALSRWILWNKTTLRASLKDFKRRFHV